MIHILQRKSNSIQSRQPFTLWLATGLMALGLAVTSISAAAEKGAEQTKTGTVKKVDLEGKKVTVMVTRELTFTAIEQTKITQDDKPKALADIKADDKVSVDYVKDGETRTASKIVILKDK